MLLNRDATSVVGNFGSTIGHDFDNYFIAGARHGFIDRVVDYFVNHVVQSALADITDIHCRTALYRLKSFENLDSGSIVAMASAF